MIEVLQGFWNDHVPPWFKVRCTDRFIGHMLFFAFITVAYLVISLFSVSVATVLERSLFGAMFFLATRFVLPRHSTKTTTMLAVFFVILMEVVTPLLLGTVGSFQTLFQRFPALVGMTVLEVLEEDSLEEQRLR